MYRMSKCYHIFLILVFEFSVICCSINLKIYFSIYFWFYILGKFVSFPFLFIYPHFIYFYLYISWKGSSYKLCFLWLSCCGNYISIRLSRDFLSWQFPFIKMVAFSRFSFIPVCKIGLSSISKDIHWFSDCNYPVILYFLLHFLTLGFEFIVHCKFRFGLFYFSSLRHFPHQPLSFKEGLDIFTERLWMDIVHKKQAADYDVGGLERQQQDEFVFPSHSPLFTLLGFPNWFIIQHSHKLSK